MSRLSTGAHHEDDTEARRVTPRIRNVYKNDEDGAPIPSLYIDKAAFKKEPPKTITVEIPEIK
jgi:hypothetical protein